MVSGGCRRGLGLAHSEQTLGSDWELRGGLLGVRFEVCDKHAVFGLDIGVVDRAAAHRPWVHGHWELGEAHGWGLMYMLHIQCSCT